MLLCIFCESWFCSPALSESHPCRAGMWKPRFNIFSLTSGTLWNNTPSYFFFAWLTDARLSKAVSVIFITNVPFREELLFHLHGYLLFHNHLKQCVRTSTRQVKGGFWRGRLNSWRRRGRKYKTSIIHIGAIVHRASGGHEKVLEASLWNPVT